VKQASCEDRGPTFEVVMFVVAILEVDYAVCNSEVESIVVVVLDAANVSSKEESFDQRHKE
jgi:hypothetical protein